MAELLIKAKDHVNPDSNKDRMGAYKRGMIVNVMPDGHRWGSKETLPKFVIVKIPGLAIDKVQPLTVPQIEDDSGQDIGTDVFRRRRWRLLIDNVPSSIKNKLRDTGEVTVTKTQIRNYLKRIRDNVQYTEMD